ncbi:MAG: hypothetical protein ACKN9V_07090 [Pseudomonadota bacterium]
MKKPTVFSDTLSWVLTCTSVVFLVFFRGRWAFMPGVYDEQCYLEWLHKFIGVPYRACYSSSHLPGVAIQWIPVGWFSRFLSYITGSPLSDWLESLIGLQTFATWGVCLFLFHKIFLALEVPFPKIKSVALLFFLNMPVLEFMTQLNFGTVPAELLLSSMLVFCLIKERWLLAIPTAFLLNLTRVNDIFAFFLIVGALIDSSKAGKLNISRRNQIILGSVFLAFLLAALTGVLYIGLVTGYNHVFLGDILPRLSPYRWWRGLFMGQWGVFWTAPAAIISFIICCYFTRRLSWLSRAGLLWVFSELALVIALNEIRADYINPPWRYLLGSFIGMIPAIVETSRHLSQPLKKGCGTLFNFLAGWQLYLAFVTHSFTILNYWKAKDNLDDWSLLEYLHLLQNPLDLIKLFYVAPVGFTLFSWCKDWRFFKNYEQYTQYALQGPKLYLLTASTLLALAIVVIYIRDTYFRKSGEVLQ